MSESAEPVTQQSEESQVTASSSQLPAVPSSQDDDNVNASMASNEKDVDVGNQVGEIESAQQNEVEVTPDQPPKKKRGRKKKVVVEESNGDAAAITQEPGTSGDAEEEEPAAEGEAREPRRRVPKKPKYLEETDSAEPKKKRMKRTPGPKRKSLDSSQLTEASEPAATQGSSELPQEAEGGQTPIVVQKKKRGPQPGKKRGLLVSAPGSSSAGRGKAAKEAASRQQVQRQHPGLPFYAESTFVSVLSDLGRTNLQELVTLVKAVVAFAADPNPTVSRDEFLSSKLTGSQTQWRIEQIRVALGLIAHARDLSPIDDATVSTLLSRDIHLEDLIGRYKAADWWKDIKQVPQLEQAAFAMWATNEVVVNGGVVAGLTDNASLINRWNAADPVLKQPLLSMAAQAQHFKDLLVTAQQHS